MEFSRQEYWSGFPYPPPGDLLDPGIEPGSPALQDSLPAELPGKHILIMMTYKISPQFSYAPKYSSIHSNAQTHGS